jgi:hypothetical protein
MLNAFGYALKYLDQNHDMIAKMGSCVWETNQRAISSRYIK